jgi:outer membrane protein assembly factor BamD (BamD/ComL family)
MKRILLSLTVCAIFRFSADAEAITSPAEKLYTQACMERAKGDPKSAIQTAVKVIALYSGEKEWLARSELLSAELYLELGMPEAADITARQIQNLYAGMDVAKKADVLRSKIKELKKEAE